MSKNEKRGYVIVAVLLVLLSVYALEVPFERSGAFWWAYAFGVIALLFQIYVFRIAFKGVDTPKSKFYGFPVIRVGIIYLVTQLILSMAEMALAWMLPDWVAIVINAFPIAFAIIGCIETKIAREEIGRQENTLSSKTDTMNKLKSQSVTLAEQCDDDELKKTISKLAEEFKYSDPVSSENTSENETILAKELDELKNLVVANDIDGAKDLCKKISLGLAERNRLCKSSK